MDYNKLAEKVEGIIGRYGCDITVRCSTLGTYDPATDSYAKHSVDYSVNGLLLNFNRRDIDGTVVQVGDRQLLIPALTTLGVSLPDLEDVWQLDFIYNSETLNVQSITSLKPGGTGLLYRIHVRR